MPKNNLPDWERLLNAATKLQQIVPGSVLVGGTAASLHAGHRKSSDADHVVSDLRGRFDEVLAELESVVGWKTARINRPVQILGNLDGIDTGIRQLRRTEPLETVEVDVAGAKLVVPTMEEILRVKAFLILDRNATRDYLDFAALADGLGDERMVGALRNFDLLYPQDNGASPLLQLQNQLVEPMPYDLKNVDLSNYKGLDPRWHDWNDVRTVCAGCSEVIFEKLILPDNDNQIGL